MLLWHFRPIEPSLSRPARLLFVEKKDADASDAAPPENPESIQRSSARAATKTILNAESATAEAPQNTLSEKLKANKKAKERLKNILKEKGGKGKLTASLREQIEHGEIHTAEELKTAVRSEIEFLGIPLGDREKEKADRAFYSEVKDLETEVHDLVLKYARTHGLSWALSETERKEQKNRKELAFEVAGRLHMLMYRSDGFRTFIGDLHAGELTDLTPEKQSEYYRDSAYYFHIVQSDPDIRGGYLQEISLPNLRLLNEKAKKLTSHYATWRKGLQITDSEVPKRCRQVSHTISQLSTAGFPREHILGFEKEVAGIASSITQQDSLARRRMAKARLLHIEQQIQLLLTPNGAPPPPANDNDAPPVIRAANDNLIPRTAVNETSASPIPFEETTFPGATATGLRAPRSSRSARRNASGERTTPINQDDDNVINTSQLSGIPASSGRENMGGQLLEGPGGIDYALDGKKTTLKPPDAPEAYEPEKYEGETLPGKIWEGYKKIISLDFVGGRKLEWWTIDEIVGEFTGIFKIVQENIQAKSDDKTGGLKYRWLRLFDENLAHIQRGKNIEGYRSSGNKKAESFARYPYQSLLEIIRLKNDVPTYRGAITALAKKGLLRLSDKKLVGAILGKDPDTDPKLKELYKEAEREMDYTKIQVLVIKAIDDVAYEWGWGYEVFEMQNSGYKKNVDEGESIGSSVSAASPTAELNQLYNEFNNIAFNGDGRVLGMIKKMAARGNLVTGNGINALFKLDSYEGAPGGFEIAGNGDYGLVLLKLLDAYLTGTVNAESIGQLARENESGFITFCALDEMFVKKNKDTGRTKFEDWGWVTTASDGSKKITHLGLTQIPRFFNTRNAKAHLVHQGGAEIVVHIATDSNNYKMHSKRFNSTHELKNSTGDKAFYASLKNGSDALFAAAANKEHGHHFQDTTRTWESIIKALCENIRDSAEMLSLPPEQQRVWRIKQNEYTGAQEKGAEITGTAEAVTALRSSLPNYLYQRTEITERLENYGRILGEFFAGLAKNDKGKELVSSGYAPSVLALSMPKKINGTVATIEPPEWSPDHLAYTEAQKVGVKTYLQTYLSGIDRLPGITATPGGQKAVSAVQNAMEMFRTYAEVDHQTIRENLAAEDEEARQRIRQNTRQAA